MEVGASCTFQTRPFAFKPLTRYNQVYKSISSSLWYRYNLGSDKLVGRRSTIMLPYLTTRVSWIMKKEVLLSILLGICSIQHDIAYDKAERAILCWLRTSEQIHGKAHHGKASLRLQEFLQQSELRILKSTTWIKDEGRENGIGVKASVTPKTSLLNSRWKPAQTMRAHRKLTWSRQKLRTEPMQWVLGSPGFPQGWSATKSDARLLMSLTSTTYSYS